MSLPVRRPPAARRVRRPVRRRRTINLWRLLGALLMAVAAGGLGWLLTDDDFDVVPAAIDLRGLHYTDAQLVHGAMAPWLGGGANAFGLSAAQVQREIIGLPAVAQADVQVILPDRLVVAVVERVPVFVWRAAATDYLVDGSGVLLRAVLPDEALPAQLPLVDDRRPRDDAVQAGDVLAPVDLQAILKLGAVDPGLLESEAGWLDLSVEAEDGYMLTAQPDGWRAVFGHYTPSLRTPDIIDRQVQCLRALLSGGEDDVEVIYLSPVDERCGTYVARTTPAPSDVPAETPKGAPADD